MVKRIQEVALNKELKDIVQKKKFLVFDFDGVILDSVELKARAFGELYSRFGDDVSEKVVAYNKINGGISRYEKFRIFHREFLNQSITARQISDLDRKLSNILFKAVIKVKEIKGISYFLENMNNRGKRCIINSATPETELLTILETRNLARYFELALGSPSTKAENFAKMQGFFNFNFEEIMFFGDTSADAEAASSVGVDFVGVGDELSNFKGSSSVRLFIKNFEELH